MFTNNYILNLLNLKDTNLDFSDSECKKEVIKGIKTMIFTAVLKNKPKKCYHCSAENIIVHGYKTCNIKLPSVSGFNCILRLKKQRYKCKCCGKTFTAVTPIVEKNCQISYNTRQSILFEATNKISEKDIAIRYNVSHSTVNRLINSFSSSYRVNFNYLPEAICFDEFKSTKDAAGAMSFIFADAETHQIIDIVENRQLAYLEKYFMCFAKKARNDVKFVIMDMYSPYVSLVQKCFKNAKIVFDRFHIINSLTRALNKTRIKYMNTHKELYNKFKRYWKLLLKDSIELNDINRYKRTCFGYRWLTEREIVDELLSYDKELYETYRVYQYYLMALKTRNIDLLECLLNSRFDNISTYAKTAIMTFKKNSEYVLNAVKYHYSNGVIEGINNKIKVIKRIAFGYRTFSHFKNRILIMNRLIYIGKAA